MRGFELRRTCAVLAATIATLPSFAGCGDGTPSVSASTAEATVHGTVRHKGIAVKEGTITFDPANIRRRDAKMVTAPIGNDGTYTVKTLVGGNRVSFNLPSLAKGRKKDFGLPSTTFGYDVPGGDSTYDVELSPRNP